MGEQEFNGPGPEVIKPVEGKDFSVFTKMGKLTRKVAETMALMVALSFPAGAPRAQAGEPEPEPTRAVQLDPTLGTPEQQDAQKYGIDWHWNFIDQEKGGFNPWSLVTPGQVELSQDKETNETQNFVIPNEYARLFAADKNAEKPLSPEDHAKVVELIDQELKTEFADALYGLDMSTRDPHAFWTDKAQLDNLTVTDIEVTGTTSPEGPQGKGPATFASGAIDQENLDLAEVRGESGLNLTAEQIAKLGVNLPPDVLKAATEKVQTEEIQFSDQELAELAELAQNYPGATDAEKTFNLIVDYNDGKVTDQNIAGALDKIIASKRSVEETITYQGDQTRKVVIPIPILLLLALRFIPWRRKEKTPTEETTPEPNPPKPAEPPTEEPPAPEELPVTPTYRKLEEVTMPEKGTLSHDEMEEATYIDDLYIFMDREKTINRGLDYRAIADEASANFYKYETPEDRELATAETILKAWHAHDLALRREAGVAEDQLENGLDYENQPDQIKWARMHARAILQTVEAKRALPVEEQEKADYLDILSPKVRELMQRRMLRPRGE